MSFPYGVSSRAGLLIFTTILLASAGLAQAPAPKSSDSKPLKERMAAGGKSVTIHTDSAGKARLSLPEFDDVADIHASYQLVIRFNSDHKYREYVSAQLPQLEFYANSGLDP